MPKKPHVTLERNNTGELFLGLTEFNDTGDLAVRACVLSRKDDATVESVFRREVGDIVRLMGDNVTFSDDT